MNLKYLASALILSATLAASNVAIAVPCSQGGLSGSTGCQDGIGNNDKLSPTLTVNDESFFGYNDWIYLQKDDEGTLSTDFNYGLVVTPDGGWATDTGTYAIDSSIWDDYSDVMIVLKTGKNGGKNHKKHDENHEGEHESNDAHEHAAHDDEHEIEHDSDDEREHSARHTSEHDGSERNHNAEDQAAHSFGDRNEISHDHHDSEDHDVTSEEHASDDLEDHATHDANSLDEDAVFFSGYLLAENMISGTWDTGDKDLSHLTLYARGDGGATVTEVPEPGTIAMFGAGLIGMSAIRRRRKTGK